MVKPTQLIDTHAHLLPEYFTEQEIADIINSAPNKGLSHIINVGTDTASSEICAQMSDKYPLLYAAIGLHPHDANKFSATTIVTLRNLLTAHKKIVAIGEIGLDYHYMHSPMELQIHALKELLTVAGDTQLPIILHVREAWEEIFGILEGSGIAPDKFVFHCFPGGQKAADHIQAIGASISLTGVITFPKYDSASIKDFPLDRIMLETDCPYLTPVPFRGKQNRPEHVNLVAAALAQIKNIPLEQVIKQTTTNAIKFYQLQ